MRTLKLFGAAAMLLLLAAPDALAARHGATGRRVPVPRRAAAVIDNNDRLAVNNLDMFVTNHGSLAYDLPNSASGLYYPRGTLKTAVYAAGLWIGAKAYGPTDTIGVSTPDLRVAVGEYSQEFTPGPMVDPLTGAPCTSGCVSVADNATFRNFRFSRSSPLTGDDRTQYFAQGGPTDSLGNPALLGDEMIWSVFNDADPEVHTNRAGSTTPLGVEVQQSVFAFARSGALGNIIFVKWLIINKGSNTLDSTFVSVWSDPDLGGAGDDLVGCDTLLSLGYCYNATNSDQLYGATPPAVGFDFFKGPSVGGNPLGMVSFNKYINGTDPQSPLETYNYMRGLNKDGTPVHILDIPTNPITRYQVSGLDPSQPSSVTNWLDSNPADRRLMLSSGPFTMAPGDTQEVVTAIIIGQGQNRFASVADLKNKDTAAQAVFDLNFDIPTPPPAPTVYVQPLDQAVRLIWDASAVGTHSFSDTLNQDFVFEGYRVWQLPSAGVTSTAKVIATFDEAGNEIGPIYSDLFNSDKGAVERTLVIAGTDEGLRFQIDITNDAIRGGPLVNYKDYYFAVTAFAYDSMNVVPYFDLEGINQIGVISEVLESGILANAVQVTPRGSNSLFTIEGTQISGDLVGNRVVVEQLEGRTIADSTYRVVFAPDESWSLINVATGDTVLTGQTSVSGGFDSPIVNGFMTRVIQSTDPASVAQLIGGSGLLGAADSIALFPPGETDSSGTFELTNFVDPSDISWWTFNDTVRHDYVIHVLPDTTQYAWTYTNGGVATQATFKVPFEVYDLGACSYADPSDDVKITVMARDLDGNGHWSWGDAIYFWQIPYASVAWNTPINSATYDPTSEGQTLGRFTFNQVDTTATLPTEARIRIRGGRLCPQDVFTFRTVPAGSAPGTVVQNELKRILAVPNPYYAHSQYELTQFNRVMKFTNIPASREVTIRIFNLAGDLVRTIRRSASNGDDMSSAQIIWDLNTNRNLPVASGVYIVRIDVDGVGSKTLRVAVFIEQERLDNF